MNRGIDLDLTCISLSLCGYSIARYSTKKPPEPLHSPVDVTRPPRSLARARAQADVAGVVGGPAPQGELEASFQDLRALGPPRRAT